jgi:predicted amidohydrolase YtcJ
MLVHPVRSVVAAGAPLVLGSDATPERASPARMLQATLTDFRVQERLGPSMGPACLTTALARAAGEAESVGTIEVGRRADLVVLDRDLLRVPPDLVGSSRVLLTVAAGEVTHRSEL